MTQVGTPSQFQLDHKILVSCMAAYPSRPEGLLKLIKSCEKFGVQLTIFGEGEPFVNMYETKLQRLGELISPLRHQYNYIINIDAADTLFLRPFDELKIEAFPLMGMVFAAELNNFPFNQLLPLYEKKGSFGHYKYLNGGGFIANMYNAQYYFGTMKAERVLRPQPDLINDFTDEYRDDQAAWAYRYLRGSECMLDENACLFQTLCLVDQEKDLRIEDGKLFNNITGTQPFILHANGSADYQNIYNKIILND